MTSYDETRRLLSERLQALRRQASSMAWWKGLRFALPLAALVFWASARGVAPSAASLVAALAWLSLALVLLWPLVRYWRRARKLERAGIALLFEGRSSLLRSKVRSAVELAEGRPLTDPTSKALVEAHRLALLKELDEQTRPWRGDWQRALRHGLVAAALTFAALLVAERLDGAFGSGRYALLHPEARNEEGERLALLLQHFTLEVRPPGPSPRRWTLRSPERALIPTGSDVRLRLRSRMPLSAAELWLDGRPFCTLHSRSGRDWEARFRAESSGTLTFHWRRAEGWYADPRQSRLEIREDLPPRVRLLEPAGDRLVAAGSKLKFRFSVEDDVALGEVALLLRDASGREERRPIKSFAWQSRERVYAGSTELEIASTGVGPGESMVVWIEALDRRSPEANRGRSAARMFMVALSPPSEPEAVEHLQGALDLGLTAVADRLEHRLPRSGSEDPKLTARIRKSTQRFQQALRTSLTTSTTMASTELASRAERLRRLSEQELRTPAGTSPAKRGGASAGRGLLEGQEKLEKLMLRELEDSVLDLDRLLSERRLEEILRFAEQLLRMHEDLRSLLEESAWREARGSSRPAVEETIARAEQIVSLLRERLQQLIDASLDEFSNPVHLSEEERMAQALRGMRQGLSQSDLPSTRRHLRDFRRALEAFFRNWSSSLGESARKESKGQKGGAGNPLERLRSKQEELWQQTRAAREGEALKQGAADLRVLEKAYEESKQQVEKALEQRYPPSNELHREARKALSGLSDALSARDFGDALARSRQLSLQLEDWLGPMGFGRETPPAERKARQALSELRGRLESMSTRAKSTPKGGKLQELARRQGQIAEESKALPASKGKAAETLAQAESAMREAKTELAKGNMTEALAQQERALTLLDTLGSEGSNQGRSGRAAPDARQSRSERVDIPGAGSAAAKARRARIIEAMRGKVPQGYREAVRRYFEEVLR